MIIYTVEQMAEKLTISKRSVERAVEAGYLSGSKIAGKWRFTEEQLEDMLAQRTPTLTEIHKKKREAKKRKALRLSTAA